ncbi:MAG: (2Fe-2S)-binding protein [Proteobacteria bacterium]|jgi:aerobic-type carbon monoxide dehydrogenase small subunit (CoxS/CutS family)|nr:(2Fe-2S)-binding protein [Pseudomonadota bacterium]
MITLNFILNDDEVTVSCREHDLLIDILRGPLNLTGTKEGCGKGECGACTVIVDERPVNACLYPAPDIEGCTVLTIEGLTGPGNDLSPIQQAFVDNGGIQCGFCTPGMILSAHSLLLRNPQASDDEIRSTLAGNLCRCTGYVQIIDSVNAAAGGYGKAS